MAANVVDQRGTDWSSQYGMVARAGRENGMETPRHENPAWEKARGALASIGKVGAAGSSKASSNGPVAGSQSVSQAEASALQQHQHFCQWYPQCSYAYPVAHPPSPAWMTAGPTRPLHRSCQQRRPLNPPTPRMGLPL